MAATPLLGNSGNSVGSSVGNASGNPGLNPAPNPGRRPADVLLPATGLGAVGSAAPVWIYLAWLSTYLLEGPLRGGLFAIGQQNLLYLRDAVAVVSIALALAVPLVRGDKLPPGLVVMVWLLAVHACIGMLMGGTLFQRLFGVKIFIPVLYTVAIFPAVQQHFTLFLRGMAVCFTVSVVGVLVNEMVGEMPWEGLRYDTAFGTVQATRQWWMTGGLRRLAGLARASFDAAMMIGVCGVMFLAIARPLWLRVLVAAAGMVAIFLTTSKGMVAAFGAAVLWLALANRSPASFKVGVAIVVSLLLLTCLVPTVFMVVSVPTHPQEIPPLLSSLWDRFSWMWPSAYELLPGGFGPLTGVGLGGIGTALEHPDERAVHNSGDSIFVYFFVTFGLAGIAYLVVPLLTILHLGASTDRHAFVWAGLLVITYGYGLSINMVEQPFYASVLGLLYGKAFAVLAGRGATT
jgi:hypothetical protein